MLTSTGDWFQSDWDQTQVREQKCLLLSYVGYIWNESFSYPGLTNGADKYRRLAQIWLRPDTSKGAKVSSLVLCGLHMEWIILIPDLIDRADKYRRLAQIQLRLVTTKGTKVSSLVLCRLHMEWIILISRLDQPCLTSTRDMFVSGWDQTQVREQKCLLLSYVGYIWNESPHTPAWPTVRTTTRDGFESGWDEAQVKRKQKSLLFSYVCTISIIMWKLEGFHGSTKKKNKTNWRK